MKVSLDKPFAAMIRKKVIDFYVAESEVENKSREKDNLRHVSDAVFPRKTYYEITEGRKITDKAIGFWFLGKAIGSELQRILGKEHSEVEARWENFVAHMDYFGEWLIEIKSSRKWTVAAKPSPWYVRQAVDYCAVTGRKEAMILVVYPTSGRNFRGKQSSTIEMAAWKVTLTDKELEAVREDMRLTSKALDRAVQEKNPADLPPVPPWLLEDYPGAIAGEHDLKKEEMSPMNYVDIQPVYEGTSEGKWKPLAKPKLHKGSEPGTKGTKVLRGQRTRGGAVGGFKRAG